MNLLAFYFESSWPVDWALTDLGVFFTENYWCPKKFKNIIVLNEEVVWGDANEQFDDVLEAQKASGKAMIVRGLKKEFKNKLAVDGLNLYIYEGQTFAF